MKQKPPRWVQITAAVLRRYLALDMAVYAGSATLFLLTASFPLLIDRKSTRLNSSHPTTSRMPSSA